MSALRPLRAARRFASAARPLVSEADVAAYHRDGVVCLRGVVKDWVAPLQAAMRRHATALSDRGRVWNRDAEGRTTLFDSQVWRDVPEYGAFVKDSPMAAVAGALMRSEKVRFFFDSVFMRSPGAQFRTPFHQDEPFWSVSGYDTCSAWMPLVPVERCSTLEFLRGSHHLGPYRQPNFGAMVGDERDAVRFDEEKFAPFPDVEGRRQELVESGQLLGWAMEPGDVVVFNARMIHGGSGNLAKDRELIVFNTQWLGDDARVCFRETGMDPDHRQIMTRAGLKHGDKVATAVYPEVWRAESSAATLA